MTKIVTIPEFDKNFKRLNKKYGSLKDELQRFVELTVENGVQGDSLGHGLYKARLAIKSKQKGKRGGLRIISHYDLLFSSERDVVCLIAIYDKSEISSIDKERLEKIISIYLRK